jgi:uncharacterized membrane protein (UPF0136 family)
MTFDAPNYTTPPTSYTAPLPRPTNGLATAALVLGIVAAAGALIPFLNIGSMIIAVIGAILGATALARARTVQVGFIRAWFGIILALATLPVAIVVTTAASDVLAETSTTPAVLERPEPAPSSAPAPPRELPGTVAQDQARLSAESYLVMGGFSRTGLLGQLAYEGFTDEDAEHAVDSLTIDWNEQAALSATGYLEMGGFSRESLIDQLLYEGFTQDQAEYGVGQVGL